jgi:hypothetical protein
VRGEVHLPFSTIQPDAQVNEVAGLLLHPALVADDLAFHFHRVFFADSPKANIALGVKPRFPVLRIDLQDRLQFSIAPAYAAFDERHGKSPGAPGPTMMFPVLILHKGW